MTTKETILSTIQTHKPELFKLGIRDIGLFGSYVRGEQADKSDIDILIDFEPDRENYDNYMAVYDLVEQLFMNERIENQEWIKPLYWTKDLKRGCICLRNLLNDA